MTPEEAVERIRKQVEKAELVKRDSSNATFTGWLRDTRQLLARAFGAESEQVGDFLGVNYRFSGFVRPGCHQDARNRGIDRAKALLESIASEAEEFGLEAVGEKHGNPLLIVEKICDRFHRVAQQLRARYNDRDTIDVKDEYDVQDLLHALLRVEFDDVRSEEYTPSYAGGASRMDFLLKNERVVVEVKMARKGLTDKKIGEQLLVDIGRYAAHPNCEQLVCFVYNPDGWVKNPAGLESDLSGEETGLPVTVLVRPVA